MTEELEVHNEHTVTGLPEDTEAALAYLFLWVSGIVFLFIEKKNKKIRFHALQSLFTFGIFNLLLLIPIVGTTIMPGLMIIFFGLWLFLIVYTHQGGRYEIPVIGSIAKKQAGL